MTDISIWQATARNEVNAAGPLARLNGAADYEVVVIGAGFTGLSAALHLAEQRVSVAVLDAHDIGWGASGRTGGQVNPLLPVATPDELFALMPPPYAERLARVSLGSADFLFSLIKRHQIRCDARQTGWLRAHHSTKARQQAEQAAQQWAAFGAEIQITEAEETAALTGTKTYRSASLNPSGGLVHPLKLAIGLAQAISAHTCCST
ncbi:MAG: NAD(P)/FAD-dependent oxidoreductase [Candidatus Puniceispirillaceae bacterium]